MVMHETALVAALEREVAGLIRDAKRVAREHEGRTFIFFERDESVIVCGGIGVEAARRAAEAAIALYHPVLVQSVGFAGALEAGLRVGDMFCPGVVVDVRDGSRAEIPGGNGGVLLTFVEVARREQKMKLAKAFGAQAVDMEAAGVAAAAKAHGLRFSAARVISDELDFEMPETARFIDARGRFRTAGFAIFVALRPWLWRRVALLAGNSSKAAKVLCEHLRDPSPVLNHAVEAKTSSISSNSR
jgi:adenosylhomocysteine nucleosidase